MLAGLDGCATGGHTTTTGQVIAERQRLMKQQGVRHTRTSGGLLPSLRQGLPIEGIGIS